MIRSWRERLKKVGLREREYALADLEVSQCRLALRQQVEQNWMRAETLFWLAVTGYIWLSRREEQDEEERGGIVAELLASVWVMNRWRRLSHTVSDAAQRARASSPAASQGAGSRGKPA